MRTLLPGLAIWSAGTAFAGLVVLDFEQNKQVGGSYRFLPPTYEEDGYRLTTGTVFCHAQMPMSGVSDFWAGSTGMSTCIANDLIVLRRLDGQAFDFISIDIAPFARSYGFNVALTFTGYKKDGTTVSRTLTGPPAMRFDHYTFSGFNNLMELRWRHGVYPYHQFDNIVLNQVPEPTTGALLSVGGLALILRRRRG